MLQSEFESLVGMRVTPEEYSHIEAVYMRADVNKTDFCYYWKQINKSRIAEAKARLRESEEKERRNARLLRIMYKMKNSKSYFTDLAVRLLSEGELRFLKECGIDIEDKSGLVRCFKSATTVAYEIKKLIA